MSKVITHTRQKRKDESDKREHNHFSMGHMGYNPKLARLQNHDKQNKRHK